MLDIAFNKDAARVRKEHVPEAFQTSKDRFLEPLLISAFPGHRPYSRGTTLKTLR